MTVKYTLQFQNKPALPIQHLGAGDHVLFPDFVGSNSWIKGLYCEFWDSGGELFTIDDPFVIRALRRSTMDSEDARHWQNHGLKEPLDFGSYMHKFPKVVELAPGIGRSVMLFAAHMPPDTTRQH